MAYGPVSKTKTGFLEANSYYNYFLKSSSQFAAAVREKRG